MNRELERLATQIYTEYNSGVDLEQFVPSISSWAVENARGQGPDVFAVERLNLLRPDLEVVGYAYRIENPDATRIHEHPKRTVPAIRGKDGGITIFDPFLPDFVDGVEQRVYDSGKESQYPIKMAITPQITEVRIKH